jgi:hypothetical protein
MSAVRERKKSIQRHFPHTSSQTIMSKNEISAATHMTHEFFLSLL